MEAVNACAGRDVGRLSILDRDWTAVVLSDDVVEAGRGGRGASSGLAGVAHGSACAESVFERRSVTVALRITNSIVEGSKSDDCATILVEVDVELPIWPRDDSANQAAAVSSTGWIAGC